MKTIVVIPARLHASRLPNKVLLDLKGKPVIQRVYEQCKKAKKVDAVYIATDHTDIQEVCLGFTENVIMTKSTHESGTDRIAEVAESLECAVVINVQGDEPFMDPLLIDTVAEAFVPGVSMVSAMHKITKISDLKSSNVVKVVVDRESYALYFSRAIIPHHRDAWEGLLTHHDTIPSALIFFRHLGIYGYTKAFLLEYAKMEQSYLERVERLEQLRVIENGHKIKMIETDYNSIGIDTEEDYQKALKLLDGVEKGFKDA